MKKTGWFFAALIILSSSNVKSYEANAEPFCRDCGSFSALVTNALAVVASVTAPGKADCQEVQISKTCSATFYGKGDNFTGGTTACGNRFRPLQDKTVAIKTVASGGFFSKSLCGKKAFITTYDPTTKRTKSVEVKITDSGSMGGKTSKRCMDLSYRAAFELGIVQRGVASNTTIKVCK